MVSGLRHDVRIGRMVEHGSHARVDLILKRIPQVRIRAQLVQEARVHLVQLDRADLQRRDLVEILPADLSVVAKAERSQDTLVLRTILVVERRLELSARDVLAAHAPQRNAQQSREAQRGRHTEFRRGDLGFRNPLPVAREAEVQPLAAVEEILVVEVQLGREAQQVGSVGGSFQIDLEAQLVQAGQADVAIHGRAVGRAHLDADAVEDLEGGQAGVGRIDDLLVVERPGLDDIEFAQQRLPERDAGRVGNVDLADMVHPRFLADAVV